MNRIFRIVWSQALQAWVVVSELAMRRGKGGSRAAVALLALALPAQAADRHWDANGTAVGSGGAGTWNTTGLFWSPSADGVSGPYGAWNNALLDNAIFGGTAGTVTLGSPITVHNLTFNAHNYTLTGNTLTLAGTTPTININSGAASIGSTVAGTSGLTKTGGGHLHLTGSNTFSGGVNLLGGRLAVYSDAALGNAGNGVTMANGTELFGAGTALANSRVVTVNGTVTILGAGVGSARFTGSGGIDAQTDVTLSNDANDYTGMTRFTTPGFGGTYAFTSIADLGVASALGAPTTVSNGTIAASSSGGVATTVRYLGSGHSSNRNWSLFAAGAPAPVSLVNAGTGALTLSGNIAMSGTGGVGFLATSGDLALLGAISGTNAVAYGGTAGRTILLGGSNTYSGANAINAVTVVASELADAGIASSLGTNATGGITIAGNGVLSYTGTGDGSNRVLTLNNGTIRNDGSGALTLSGSTAITNAFTLGGSFAGAPNVHSGVVSGTGSIAHNGAGTWWLYGANTYTGGTSVLGGTLVAGNANAFGTGGFVVNGGTLSLNDFDMTAPTLAGTGGAVALGSATLTLDVASGTSSYAGGLSGTGGLVKRGGGTQVLSGSNTYTGDTAIQGGTLRLDFSAAGGPTADIVSAASKLVLSGGTLAVVGENGVANTQAFNGVDVLAGANTVGATSGTGGSATVHLGTITHGGGLVNFLLPTSGNLTTTNTTLGGWATVNGTDYAKVVGGNITAFTAADYVNKDNAATWLGNEIVTDTNGFFGTVGSTVQLGGLRYTRPVSTTVTIAAGQALGIDGTILVAPSVSTTNQLITGGQLTGTAGGGVVGLQQNSGGNFTIASRIVDNGGAIGFTKSGTGLATLDNATSDYTGATIVGQGILSVSSIANGGAASAIGASSSDASNLVLQGSTLRYTGGSTNSDRGFTLAKSGAIQGGTIEVTNGAANLAFGGLVTSSDGAGLLKIGPGTLTLGNANNDYAGATTVNGGTLSVGTLANGGLASGIGASGSASSNLVLNGGELEYTGATATTDRGLTLGASHGAIDVANAASTLTVAGTLVGTGALTKRGDGTLVLSGNNTFSGGASITAGTLRLGSANALGTAGLTSLGSTGNATLDLNGFDATIGPLSGGGLAGGNILLGSGRLTIAMSNCAGSGTCGTYGGVISGTGGVTLQTGGGSQAMTGCRNTYTGSTIINGGATLVVDCLANGGLASGIGASSSAPANLVFGGGQMTYTGGSVSIDRGFQTTGGALLNVVDASTVLQFSGQVTGAGVVSKTGAGTLVLSGNNTYTGTTGIFQGILRLGSSTAVNGTAVAIGAATLDLDGFNTSIYGLDGIASSRVELDGATLAFNEGGNLAYYGTITGTGGLVKNGGSAQQLYGCNSTYTGPTVLNAGAIQLDCLRDGGQNSSVGASSAAAANLVINGGSLTYVGTGDTTNRQFTLGTASPTLNASGTGALNFTSTAPVTLAGTNTARTLTLTGTNTGNNTLAAQLTNTGTGITSLTKSGTGTWVLTNNSSTYTGATSIVGGVLVVDYMANGGLASAMGASSNAASNLLIGNGATLRYIGTGNSTDRLFTLAPGVSFIESSGSGAINFTNTAAATYSGINQARTLALGGTNTGLNTMGGTITNAGTGVTTLAKNDSGTWVLTGNNTYSGNTVINDGNLIIGNGGTSGNAGTGNVIIDSATSTLSLNRSDAFTFNGTLSGPGTLAQIGTGTSTLTAANSSVGATAISAGTLDVNGGLTTPTIAINGTATLNVDGTVQGAGATPVALVTGNGGSSTIDVNAGATLRASGDLGDGNDAVRVAGLLDTGAGVLDLGAGDDTLTLRDGATLTGAGVSGGLGANDLLVLDNALALAVDAGQTASFERLLKQNTGTATLSGTQGFDAGATVTGGTLEVDGALILPTVALGDDTALVVDGSLQGPASGSVAITGSAGANTIVVNGTARANGQLGDGDDVLDVAGLLDTGPGAIDLGNGDDTLTIHEGTTIVGTVIAGAGTDAFDTHIDTNASLGAVQGFETLRKTGVGVLDVNGPASSDFVNVEVLAGTLHIGSGGSVDAALPGNVLDTVVAIGATLQVDGRYGCGDGDDTMDVSGTVSGTGTIDLCGGDDVLTLRDGAVLANRIEGGTEGAGDTLVLDNANALAFSGDNTTGFETLRKDGSGTATMTGVGAFLAGTAIDAGALDIDGILLTPTVALADDTTLHIDGALLAGAAPTTITGTAGTNIFSVGVGGDALANGDLGDGDDTLDIAGTLDTGGGTFFLGAGDDRFVVHDGTVVLGTVDAGEGLDTRVYDIATTASIGALANFEGLAKAGAGTLHLTGPAATNLMEVEVLGGTLNVGPGGTVVAVTGGTLDTIVTAGATLHVDGAFGCGVADDTMRVAGTVAGNGTIDLCGGNDTLTLEDGAVLANVIDGGAQGAGDTVVLESAAALAFDASQTIRFETLRKDGAGTATLVGAGTFSGSTAITGGVLQVAGALQTPTVALADDTALIVDGSLQGHVDGVSTITGTAGVNTVRVNGTASATGDLGEGVDVLDIAGVLDTGDGAFLLGAGDDDFIVHDGTVVHGTVDGGDGLDSRVYDIDAAATLGALVNFEGITKTGTGTLHLAGPVATDLMEVEVLGGTLDVGPAGSVVAIAGTTLATRVAAGATLHVGGAFGCGDANDTMDVSGTVGGSGTIDLCGGDDTLTLRDGATLAATVSGGTHGPGDTVVLDVAGTLSFDAARTIQFESLRKENLGVATLTGGVAFVAGTTLDGGVLDVDGTLSTPVLTLADDTTLQVDGTVQAGPALATTVTGSAGANRVSIGAGGVLHADADFGDGDDAFASQGVVSGALAFGAGNDHAAFVDADISDLLALDGGDGANDRLTLGGMLVNDDDLPLLSGWEQGELLDGTVLQLDETMVLGRFSNPEASVLRIDPTSRLVVRPGAQLMASVANEGTIDAGANRLAIGGDYIGNGGVLQVAVSPANGTAGGLDVAGDVRGTTAITFGGDGTEANGATSILVIASPNDDLATPAAFATDGIVRLAGSALPWSFGQAADRNWYLNADADALLPEIGGYAILPGIGRAALLENNRLLFQRLSAVREDTPRCGTEPEQERAYWLLAGACRGLWMAASASELEVGADPGFAFSGDSVGLFLGADVLLQDRDTRTLRAGVFLGFQRGNHWTTGANSTAQQGIGEANVRTDTPVLGFYESIDWRSGTSLDLSLLAHRPEATITVADGFREVIPGSSLTLAARLVHRVALANGWYVEPQLQLDAIGMHWGGDDPVDDGGKGLVLDDDVFGTARVALRAGRAFETAGGAGVRPWITLGMQDTFGEKRDALGVASGSGAPPQLFPNHAPGLAATLDVGVEAELNAAVSLFGVLSVDETLEGTKAEQRQANLGVRIRW